jgi:3-oxoacyl-[acyl-carrier protein] reductase
MDLFLSGRTAVVGGATAGLGLAVARELAAEGANVVMVGRREHVLEAEAARIGASAVVADLDVPADRARIIDRTIEKHGSLDILVWNSGGPPTVPASAIDAEAARTAFDSLVVPLIDLVGLALPHLRASDGGRILAITAGGVKEPTDNGLSNTVRPGVTGYLKTLSTELAPEGITVNSIAPGRIRTERLASFYPDGAPSTLESEIPMRRFGLPEEVGSAASYLASPRAAYITGVTLVIDGGLAKGIF